MKKFYLSLLGTLLLGASQALAVPANPAPGHLTQPDGTTVNATLHGDEFHNFLTTIDGYTLLKNNNGVWCYAEMINGSLQPGAIQAHDITLRSEAERSYLRSKAKLLQPEQTETQMQMKNFSRTATQGSKGLYNYKKFKGLVILVNYEDRSFTEPNAQQIFNDIVNKENYTGFTPSGSSTKQVYTGSVRDYFHDNSAGMFTPSFDVVGPVTVPYSQYYVNQTANIRAIVAAACDKADATVDFSKYDTDGDGVVDMFYLIFAGYGSNNTGNDQRLVWPHAYTMPGNVFDGVKLNRYACSTELYGVSWASCVDGIGTICHEFSHVLGLMDEYDTDYSGSGGQSVDPGAWSVMAGGSYNNYSRTPVGYSLMQRYQSGFAVPKLLTGPADCTLVDIDSSNTGYRINTSNPKEYFLFENRRKTGSKWNVYLPGEGMLVYRVDSTSTLPWSSNTINANPEHNYYEMVRANPKGKGLAITDSDGDPFPGSGNVAAVGPYTYPGALESWNNRYDVDLQLEEIAEDANGVITFKVKNDAGGKDVEDFESMTTSSSSDKEVQGKYCKWSFTKGGVYSPGSGLCKGVKAAGLVKNGLLETSATNGVSFISMRMYNSAARTSNIRLQYYDETSGSWVILKDINNLSGNTLEANSTTTLRFNIPEEIRNNLRLQLKVVTGSDTDRLYVDNIHMRDVEIPGGQGIGNLFNTDSDMSAEIIGNGTVNVYTCASEVKAYDLLGRMIGSACTIGGQATLQLPANSICIITASNGKTLKIKL